MKSLSKQKTLSSCCEKPAKVNMASDDGALFCSHCGLPCEVSNRKQPFKGYSTLSTVRKPSGEREVFVKLWAKCKGRSQVSGEKLLPPEHPMFHFQGCHLLPKGSYQDARLEEENIVMTTVDEHTKEWPLVKEKTDAEIRFMKMDKWLPVVRKFRTARLKYNERLSAELSGKL